MPTWKPSFPEHKPFKCSTAWHLRSSGLYLAVYDLLGGVTNGGKNEFFSSIHQVSVYFEADYETTRRVFKGLRKLGFIELLANGNFKYIEHDAWTEKRPDQCYWRETLHWQNDTDPLVGKLYAVAGGKLRLVEQTVVGLRKFGTDEEIEALFRREVDAANAQRARGGGWTGTSPRECLKRVHFALKEKAQSKRPLVGTTVYRQGSETV
jgi:hypothetical protein